MSCFNGIMLSQLLLKIVRQNDICMPISLSSSVFMEILCTYNCHSTSYHDNYVQRDICSPLTIYVASLDKVKGLRVTTKAQWLKVYNLVNVTVSRFFN